MTKSEEIFESLLKDKGIIYERIPEAKSRTPDYKINLGGIDTYWEIKELEKNSKEKEIIKNIKKDIQEEAYSIDSTRIENSIKKTKGQFKEYGVLSYPCVVVLYDSREFFIKDFGFTGCVENICFGPREYASNPNGELIEVKRFYGLFTNRKKYISAISILYQHTKELTFFHNRNANHPLKENEMLLKMGKHIRF